MINGSASKSRDVLRFLIGFYQEKVAELETKLEQSRNERLKCEAGATAIREALSSAEIGTELELAEMRRTLEGQIQTVEATIAASRENASSPARMRWRVCRITLACLRDV